MDFLDCPHQDFKLLGLLIWAILPPWVLHPQSLQLGPVGPRGRRGPRGAVYPSVLLSAASGRDHWVLGTFFSSAGF